MNCPDEVTLDLWLADALTPDEAEAISAHVATCPSCAAQQARWLAASSLLHSALDLDQDERAYLSSLDVAGSWRAASAPAVDPRWGWLALLAVVAAFFTWTVAVQPFSALLDTANQVGLGTVLLSNAGGLLFGAAQTLINLSTNPALSLSQPLLAVLALTLLFWPRITSAPHFLQGVRS